VIFMHKTRIVDEIVIRRSKIGTPSNRAQHIERKGRRLRVCGRRRRDVFRKHANRGRDRERRGCRRDAGENTQAGPNGCRGGAARDDIGYEARAKIVGKGEYRMPMTVKSGRARFVGVVVERSSRSAAGRASEIS
jgi:hypothetical protein